MGQASHERMILRFWQNVDRTDGADGCWPWLRATLRKDYGAAYWQGKTVAAHRLAFYLTYGTWPEIVMHTCDNPSCCNPAHLEAGDKQKNPRECWDRERTYSRHGLRR